MDAESPGSESRNAGVAPPGDPSGLITDCAPDSPFRALDWRWRLASHIAQGLEPPRKRWADRWVRAAARSLARQAGEAKRAPRGSAAAALEGACRIRDMDDTRVRQVVEARLLAGLGDDEAAARLGLEPAAVAG
jgi:hypothetical protein